MAYSTAPLTRNVGKSGLKCYKKIRSGGIGKHVPSSSSSNIGNGVLDVLTSLSDSRQETVEKIMERRISGVSYMCWIDFHNGK